MNWKKVVFFFFFFFYQVSSLYSDNMKSYCAGVEASIYYSDKQFPGYTVLFCICFALKIMYKKKKNCIGRVLGCFKANVFFSLTECVCKEKKSEAYKTEN